jgi:hypothetical protein
MPLVTALGLKCELGADLPFVSTGYLRVYPLGAALPETLVAWVWAPVPLPNLGGSGP